jgi:alkylhydroperoxidase family enzyme
LTNEDFDKVRAQGVSDEDIVEIIVITARAVAADIMADALKVPVERATYEALGR